MFNKSKIMRRAWELVRRANVEQFGLRFILRNAMRTAWREAKAAAEAAKRAAQAAMPKTEVDTIREAIWVLDCKTRWTAADRARYSELNADLREAA